MSKGIALHIGLNLLDAGVYYNPQPLRGCIYDANFMQELAESKNYRTQQLLDQDATRANVIKSINEIAYELAAGDTFLITFSGHGTRLPDKNSDEIDGYDEAWCLYDDLLMDDELAVFWSRFKAGTRIIMISDSCHSGTVAKGIEGSSSRPDDARPKTLALETTIDLYKKNQDSFIERSSSSEKTLQIKASLVLLSGCQDNQESLDYPDQGLFTKHLKTVWDNGSYQHGYRHFLKDIAKGMPPTQSPNFYVAGENNPEFIAESPFTI